MDQAKLGVEDVLKVVTVIATLANVGDKFGAETGVGRWNHLMGLGPAILELNGIKFANVIPQIKDMDAAERELVRAKFAGVLDLKDDQLEAVIEDGLALVEKIAGLVGEVQGFVAKAKGL